MNIGPVLPWFDLLSIRFCDFAVSPVVLRDHALNRRAWTAKAKAKTPKFAVDGNDSTSATTGVTKYPFLAVDLGTILDVDFMVLNIKQGELRNTIFVINQ